MTTMSNYASDDAFTFKRQFKDVEVPGVGMVRIQTLSGAETGAIQAAQGKFAQATAGRDNDRAGKAALQVAVETISAGVVTETHQRRWPDAEGKKFIATWGAPLHEFLVAAISKFNDLDSLNLEDAAKNSEGTSDDSSS